MKQSKTATRTGKSRRARPQLLDRDQAAHENELMGSIIKNKSKQNKNNEDFDEGFNLKTLIVEKDANIFRNKELKDLHLTKADYV